MSFKNQVALYAVTLRKLYRMENLVRGKSCLRILVSSFYFYGGRIQVECGNRPDYKQKRKTKEDEVDEFVVLSENLTTILYRVYKSNYAAENIEKEVIVNTECNIDQNPRFVNGKAKSYGIILRNV